jgi:sugar O-acyltransferase (sialic acid O-acetyltransferase NeuD family)
MMVLLIGAGGHAKAIVEALVARGHEIVAYVDEREAPWLDVPRLSSEIEWRRPDTAIVLGFGALAPKQLRRRLGVLDAMIERGFTALPVVHPHAYVSPSADIGNGVTILAGAIIQPGVRLARGAIINSGAIVEHDSIVGPGTHIAPGAVVLADCTVGSCSMVGANAVILRGESVADDSLVRATTLFQGHRSAGRGSQQ